MTDLFEPLSALMSRIAGPGALSDLSRLSGGANMESWAFEWGEAERNASYVLRRAPSAEYMADRPFGHRSEEHTSELQSLMRISYAVFCLHNNRKHKITHHL